MAVYPRYQAKALLILYDTLHAILEHLPETEEMQRGVAGVVLPPLLQCWQSLPDTDRRLIPLMGCLCTVALAAGPAFQQCAAPVVQRSLQLAAFHMQAFKRHSIATTALETEVRAQRPDISPTEIRDIVAARGGGQLPFDLDFVVAAIDLVSAVFDALRNGSFFLVGWLIGQSLPLEQLLRHLFSRFRKRCCNCWANAW